MLTLIKRELRNQGYLLMLLIPAMLFWMLIAGVDIYSEADDGLIRVEKYLAEYSLVLIFLPVVLGLFSAIVRYRECNNKVVTFLHTLATTRGRIFLARCIGGVVSSMVVLLTFIGCYLAFRLVLPFTPIFFDKFIIQFSGILFLLMLTGYSLGLMAGHWGGNIIMVLLSSAILPSFMIVLVLIKGFGVQSAILLAVVTVGAGMIAWQRFLKIGL